MTVGGTGVWFYYDASGTPYALYYGGQYYYYATNAQGDVTAILNSSGTAIATYTYDAWGNPLTTTGTHALATLNPLTYRGYVYDNETELYYLQSRYYNPEVGRFLNADAYLMTGQGLLGNNMFAYCNNSPATLVDPTGGMCVVAYDEAVDPLTELERMFGGGGGGSVIGSAAGTAIVVGSSIVVAQSSAEIRSQAIAQTVTTSTPPTNSRTYTLYLLADSSGTIQYVGRVLDSRFNARMNHHCATRSLEPLYWVHGLDYNTVRGLEEVCMLACHTLNPSNRTNNLIHGISASNPNRITYLDAAYDYLENRAEDFLLNLLSWG